MVTSQKSNQVFPTVRIVYAYSHKFYYLLGEEITLWEQSWNLGILFYIKLTFANHINKFVHWLVNHSVLFYVIVHLLPYPPAVKSQRPVASPSRVKEEGPNKVTSFESCMSMGNRRHLRSLWGTGRRPGVINLAPVRGSVGMDPFLYYS